MPKKTPDVPQEPPPPEALPPTHLSNIAYCPQNVLDRSRLEFYAAVVIGVLAAVLPMSGLTRSLLLLFVLAPMVDVAWRSAWCHLWARSTKVIATTLLISIYLIVAAVLIIHDHEAAALAVRDYLKSERAEPLYRSLCFIAGLIVAYISLKLFSLLKDYLKSRRAKRLAIRQQFLETKKGWLDYQLASQESSKRLHYLVGRLMRQFVAHCRVMQIGIWFMGKEGKRPQKVRAMMMLHIITFFCESYANKTEAETAELQATATLYIESTEGYLKTLKLATKNDFLKLAGLHDYFKEQLRTMRILSTSMSKLPPAFGKYKGISQEVTAALNRQTSVWKAQIAIMRKVEGHCARMAKLTENYFERGVLKLTKDVAASLLHVLELMKKATSDDAPRLLQGSSQNEGSTPNS